MNGFALSIVAAVAFAFPRYGQSTAPEFNPAVRVGTVAHTSLTEVSGIAASRQNSGVIWAHDDSGDTNRLFAMSTEGTHLGIKRFFNLDTAAYRDGALDGRTKELLGLVASMVLRCNDCIDYHLVQCVEAGFADDELDDAMNVALVVGGSIVIPHLRHGVETLDLLRARAVGDDAHQRGSAPSAPASSSPST